MLQRIGLVYLVVAPLHLTMSTRALAVLAAVLLFGYSALCFLPVPDGTPVDLQVAGANFVAWFDRVVLGTHLYVRGPLGYDPEGLLSTLPAIAQGCLGVIAGRRLAKSSPTRPLMIGAVLGMIAGGLMALVIPVSKDLWSASFVLLTSGLTLVLLAVLHAMVDVRDRTFPLAGVATAFGINAMAAYVLHYLTASVLNWKVMDALYAVAARIVGTQAGFVLPIGVFLVAIAWAMLALRRRGWIIRL